MTKESKLKPTQKETSTLLSESVLCVRKKNNEKERVTTEYKKVKVKLEK